MMRPWKLACTIAVIAIGLGAIVWLWAQRPDPEVARVKELQKTLFAQSNETTDPDERRERFEQFRGEMEKLTDEQRDEVHRETRNNFRQRMIDQVETYHRLPADERTSFLDEQIDRMEERRKQRARQVNADDGNRRGGRPGDGARGRGRGGPGRGPISDEARADRRRARLDRSTAEHRAKFAVYVEAMRERRQARGLSDERRRGPW